MSAGIFDVKAYVMKIFLADATLGSYVGTRIFDGVADQNTNYPLVAIFCRKAAKDVYGIGNIRILENVYLEVRVVGLKTSPSNQAAYEAAADRVDKVLQQLPTGQSPQGRDIYGFQRTADNETSDHTGVHTWSFNQTYRVWVAGQPL